MPPPKEPVIESAYQFYTPVKTDMIDVRMGEFLNNYPDKDQLKVMFIRECEGIYLFGTRRVNIKAEKNNIVVRKGGGYIKIEEFIIHYTPIELERLTWNDPIKKMTDKALFTYGF